MKNFIYKSLLLLGLLVSSQSFGQCPEGNVSFTTQAQVSQFLIDYPNCTEIQGNLNISGNNITSLSPLSNLTSISGSLSIFNTTSLNFNGLNGLHNLTSVGNHLVLQNNILSSINHLSSLIHIGGGITVQSQNGLTSLQGLQNVNSITGSLYIYQNSSLQSLQGLSGLTAIGTSITLYDNNSLTSLQGLNNVNTVGGFISIDDNDGLTSLQGLEGITSHQGDIIIQRNDNLTSVDGLDNLTSVGGVFRIGYTAGIYEAITSIQALENLVSVGGNFSILSQPDLESLEGLENLTTVGGGFGLVSLGVTSLEPLENLVSVGGSLAIQNLDEITSLNGLEALTSVGKLIITSNDSLNSIASLSNLTAITDPFDSIDIVNNPSLESLQGLSGITSVLGDVTIGTNVGLESLQGLHNLVSIGGVLQISYNNSLLSLEGLENLNSVGSTLSISTNSNLTSLQGLNNLNFVETLDIRSNNSLTSLQALGNLNSISGSLNIRFNNSLTSLLGLEGITSIPGSVVEIVNNSALSSLQGLHNLTSTGWSFRIENNPSLTTLQGLGSLTTVGTYFYILNNTGLISLQGIASLTSIGEVPSVGDKLRIENNTSLSVCSLDNICQYIDNGGTVSIINNAEGCNSVQQLMSNCGNIVICPIGNVSFSGAGGQEALDQFLSDYPYCTEINGNVLISGNTINDLSPLQNIISVTGDFTINSCFNLLTLALLENLESVGGIVTLSGNTNLPNLNGLHNLASVGNLSIYTNNSSNSLTDLQGLEGLTTITDEYIYIAGNNNLTSLNGLQNVDMSTVTHLYIQNHSNLSTCYTLPNICEYLINGGEATISGNTGDCLNRSAVENACPTVWNGEEWNIGEPDQNRNAIIDGNLTTNSDLTTKNITLNSGVFTLSEGNSLTVNGIIKNTQNPENFIVENESIILQNSEEENEGNVIINRNSNPMKRLDYTLWGAPVSGQKLQGFSPETLPNRIYEFVGTGWESVSAPDTSDFLEGKGYFFRSPNNYHPTNTQVFEGVFIGIPNNGDYDIAAPYQFNGISNPYPSPIDADTFIFENGISTLYFWTNNNAPVNGSYDTVNNWATYVIGSGTTANGGGLEPNGILPSGQGFIVAFETEDINREITFTNAMRTNDSNGVFFKQLNDNKHRFWLNLSNEQVTFNQIMIGYQENATQGVDTGVDAKMFAYEGNAIYSLIEGSQEQFVIQSRELPFTGLDVVSLGFRALNAGSFSISLNKLDGLFEQGNTDVYLKDHLTQTQHNLSENPYAFLSEEGVFDSRFEILYQTTMSISDSDLWSSNWGVYRQNNGLQILTSGFNLKEVAIYDMLGRKVYVSQAESTSHFIPTLDANQIYIVKIKTTENQTLHKKVR
jgi:hypothetical protein